MGIHSSNFRVVECRGLGLWDTLGMDPCTHTLSGKCTSGVVLLLVLRWNCWYSRVRTLNGACEAWVPLCSNCFDFFCFLSVLLLDMVIDMFLIMLMYYGVVLIVLFFVYSSSFSSSCFFLL